MVTLKSFLGMIAAVPFIMACNQTGQVNATLFPASGSEDVNPDTHLVLTFSETPVLGDSGMIRVYDAVTDQVVDSLDLSIPPGPTESRTYGPECDYTKVPYDYTRTVMPTNKDTRPGTPSGTAEPTPPVYQLTIIGGFTDAFHFYPVIVRDSIATIYLHNNMLEYGHTYYVTIDNGVLNLADGSFQGVTKEDEWVFTTKSDMPELSDTLIVDVAGKGDFNTVQGALDFIPDFNEQQTVILVNPGDYEELVYTRNKWHVKIKGAGMADTKVHYANNEVFNPHPLTVKTNEWPGTFPSRRAAFMLDNCKDIVIEDMTIATDLKGQAEGLLINGERIALYRVHIIGSGDALQANGTIYMESCELDGGGDTILGWVLSIPFFISCIRQQNPLTVLSKIILRKVKQFNLPPPKKMRDFCIFEDTPRLFLLGNRQFTFIAHNLDVAEDVVGQICHRHIRLRPYNPYCPDNKAVHTLLFKTEYVLDKATGLGLAPVLSLLFFCQRMIPTAFLADYRIHAMLLHG